LRAAGKAIGRSLADEFRPEGETPDHIRELLTEIGEKEKDKKEE
jgi:hypothetical protein